MQDLINRQAALKAIDTWDKFGCGPDGKLVMCDDDEHYVPYVHYEDMVHAIKSMPSADVQPVRHGKWSSGYKRQTCSVCKYKGVRSWKYCPNCGARMDGEKNG